MEKFSKEIAEKMRRSRGKNSFVTTLHPRDRSGTLSQKDLTQKEWTTANVVKSKALPKSEITVKYFINEIFKHLKPDSKN